MVQVGSGAERDIGDVLMDRYACYLAAQNASSRLKPVAFAQTYFAIQTRLIPARVKQVYRPQIENARVPFPARAQFQQLARIIRCGYGKSSAKPRSPP